MDAKPLAGLKAKILVLFPLSFFLFAAMLMVPAGSVRYWEGWAFCAVIFLPALFGSLYFLQRSPELLERRMKFKEKELAQRTLMDLGYIVFFAGLFVAAFDERFGWSAVPAWLVIVADAVVLAGWFLVFLSFRENAFAGRTIEVVEGQHVIATGPYAVVRHPMYAGLLPIFLAMPVALGSWWALLFFFPVCAGIVPRLLDEERFLRRDLQGYSDYCRRVRYRLVPWVW